MISAAASVPAVAAWKAAPTRRIGSRHSGARSSTSRPVWSEIDPWVSRMPSDTAMSATDRAASSSSTSAERKAMRSVRMVAVRYRSVTTRTRSTWASARPNSRSVGSPVITSRNRPASRWRASHWLAAWLSVALPMSTMKNGTSGTTMARITADSRSAPRMRRPAASGTTTASVSDGR